MRNVRWNEIYNSLQWIDATDPYHARWRLTYSTGAGTDSRAWLAVGQSSGYAMTYCCSSRTIHKVETKHSGLSSRLHIRCTPGSKCAFTGGRWARVHKLLVMIFQMTFQWSGIAVTLVTSNVFALIRLLTWVSHNVTISIRHNIDM